MNTNDFDFISISEKKKSKAAPLHAMEALGVRGTKGPNRF
jgi:hypothetical protein